MGRKTGILPPYAGTFSGCGPYYLDSGAGSRHPCKEIIYAAGLLHDIGRFRQYEEGIPHEQASVRIAEGILRDCGFEESEREQVLELIQSHRTKQQEKSLSGLFYKGDKLSRNCFSCPVRDKCDWPEEKKNLSIGI